MTDMKTKVKDQIKNWENSVNDNNIYRLEMKLLVKVKQDSLGQAKYHLGQYTKQWVEARKGLKRAKNRLSQLDWQKRNYTKTHIGEVLNKMQEETP